MRILFFTLLLACSLTASAQCFFDPGTGLFFNLDGTLCAITSPSVAAPFLGFGISETSQSINQIRVVAPEQEAIINSDQNPALLHQPAAYTSVQVALVPWQTSQRFSQQSAALKISVQKQFRTGRSWSLRYENFNIYSFTGPSNDGFNNFGDKNQFIRLAHARPLAKNWSFGLAAKYFRSDPNEFFFVGSTGAFSGVAADIGVKHQREFIQSEGRALRLQWGLSVTNLGPRIELEFFNGASIPIPTTLNTGLLLEQFTQLTSSTSLRISGSYQINKLLTPSFCTSCDENNNGIGDYLEYSALGGMWASLSDSPTGLQGEWQEINHQFDMSALYRFSNGFGLRQKLTLFYQHPSNGYIQYLAAELGLHWEHLQVSFFYQHPNATQFQGTEKAVGGRLGYIW